MTKKMIKHERIANKSKRNTTFKNRLEGLSKKAEELSILCGAEVGFVVHTETENNAVLWPSPEVFGERMDKFLGFSELERGKKMMLHHKHLEQQLDEVKKNVRKRQIDNDVVESRKLFNELVRGKPLNVFDLREINILRKFTSQSMEAMETEEGEQETNGNNQSVPVEDSYVPEPDGAETVAPAGDRDSEAMDRN